MSNTKEIRKFNDVDVELKKDEVFKKGSLLIVKNVNGGKVKIETIDFSKAQFRSGPKWGPKPAKPVRPDKPTKPDKPKEPIKPIEPEKEDKEKK